MNNMLRLSHSHHPADSTRNRRFGILFVLTLAALALMATPSYATGNIAKADLTGTWVATLVGNTGCGVASMQVTFTLSSSGTGSASIITHAQCADDTLNGQTFTVISLSPNGSGTAGLTCGPSCGWTFDIHVAPDRSIFNMVVVTTSDPRNYLAGVAIHE